MTLYRAFGAASPTTAADSDTGALSLGVEFYTTAASWATAVLFFQPTTNSPSTATRTVGIYNATTQALVGTTATVTPSGTGWQTATFATAIPLAANTRYVAAVFHPNGKYAADSNYFIGAGPGSSGLANGILAVPNAATATGGRQGSYYYGPALGFPNSSFNGANYWTDVTVSDVNPAGATPAGAATGGFAFAGSASGTRTTRGTAVGAFTWLGQAGGARQSSGSALGAISFAGAAAGQRPVTGPVPLSRAGSFLMANGQAVKLVGANFYDAVFSDNLSSGTPGPLPMATVTAVLDSIVAMGFNAVRIHSLFISYGKPNTNMPTLGAYNEALLVQADNVIAECRKRGLWIMAPVTDRWDFYHGGAVTFAKMLYSWAGLNEFYTYTDIRDAFKQYLTTLLNRTNTVTGIKWKDDPTLAILETGNEIWDVPADWSWNLSAWFKQNAPGKLVADGSAASGDTQYTPFLTTDGSRSNGANDPNMDIVGSHFYDDHRNDIAQVQSHQSSLAGKNKHYLIGEYDWRDTVQPSGGAAIQNAGTSRAQWLSAIENSGASDFMWCVTGPASSTHNDGYQLLVTAPQNTEQSNAKTAFTSHAAAMNQPAPAQGNASGAFTWLGTATASRQSTGSATGGYLWAGTAIGSKQVSGDAAGALTWTGSASGQKLSSSSATGAYAFTGTASGQRAQSGQSAGGFAYTGAATGAKDMAGSAVGGYGFAGTASGTAPTLASASGSAAGAFAFTGSADGATPALGSASGSATGTVSWTGAADGAKAPAGTATGQLRWAGTATGSVATSGAASGSVTWAGQAAGSKAPAGAATGSIAFTGAANGTAPVVGGAAGAALGAFGWAGTATGSASRSGTAAGAFTFVGSADGAVVKSGQATGDIAWAGSAAGSIQAAGRAVGAFLWEGQAIGSAPPLAPASGSAAGFYGWAGTASGSGSQLQFKPVLHPRAVLLDNRANAVLSFNAAEAMLT